MRMKTHPAVNTWLKLNSVGEWYCQMLFVEKLNYAFLVFHSHAFAEALVALPQLITGLNRRNIRYKNRCCTFPFTARKARLHPTTKAALDDDPEPAGTDPQVDLQRQDPIG